MEEKQVSIQSIPPSYASNYFKRASHYMGYGFLFGGLISMVLLMKFRRGAILGLGIGAGYCHKDLINIFTQYLKK